MYFRGWSLLPSFIMEEIIMSKSVSQSGLNLIKQFEGCKLTAYTDSVGVWTIGYGITNADKSITGTTIKSGLKITQNQADKWLKESVEKIYLPKVLKYDEKYDWSQNELDALISFCYNIGSIDQLTKNGTRSKSEISTKILEYNKAGGKVLIGLSNRRNAEKALFDTVNKNSKGSDNMALNIKKIQAKSVSYGGSRSLNNIKYIVIHYTGGTNDTAENEGNYFKNGNTRSAGAHFFVDQKGIIVQSIDMSLIAWAVGGSKYSDCSKTGGGKLYGICTNSNSVSIELCAIANKAPSDDMIKSTKALIAYIQKNCPNAKTIVRHFDVTGKQCPATMTSTTAWNSFLKKLDAAQVSSVSTTTTKKNKIPTLASATPALKKGSKGIQVTYLQQDLNYVMKSDLTVDGDFGTKTYNALVAFQKKYKLSADGVYGSKSKAKMQTLLK